MSLIIPDGYAQAVYRFLMAGDSEEMVTTCGHFVGDWAGDPDLIADGLFTRWANDPKDIQSSDVTFVGVDLYVGQPAGPPAVQTSSQAPSAGGAAATAAPNNVALLVRKRTDLGGRRGRGRMYVPGVTRVDVVGNGTLGVAYHAAAVAAFDNWHAALVAVGIAPPVVLHRSEGAGVEPPPTPIESFVVEQRVATQRQRLRP